jgi:hypothetical protein
VALRDLFDPDKRSKDELRSEIKQRDEQIARLSLDVAELRATNSREERNMVSEASAQEAIDESIVGNLELEVESLRSAIADLQNSLQESQDKAKELQTLVEERDRKNAAVLQELQDERSRRKDEALKNRVEYEKLLNALNVVKQKASTTISSGIQPRQLQTPTPISHTPASALVAAPPSRDRTYYSEAHRVLMEREERIQAMEHQFDELLTRFGVTDKSHILSLSAQLDAIQKELEDLRKGAEAQQLLLLRQQVSEAHAIAKKRADEGDELLRLLSDERERSSTSEAERLRKRLGEAQIEINRLQAGTSDEVWDLKRRAESAEGKIQDREFEFRNLTMRVADLEQMAKTLKAENGQLKRNTISIESHRRVCDNLTHAAALRAAAFEKDRAEYHQIQREWELRNANNQIELLTQKLEKEKTKQPTVTVLGETSFYNPTVMRWLVQEGDPETAEVPNGWLGFVGEGPWSETLLFEALQDVGYEFWPLPDADLRHLIVGRKGWTKEALVEQIDAVDGEPLRIYSEEMFLAKLITGRDPFDSNDVDLLLAFAKGHPALEYLLSLQEPWPIVSEGDGGSIDEVDGDDYGVAETPLHLLGYHVGATSQLTVSERRDLLTQCFKTHSIEFTKDSSEDYRRKWGRGGSAQRLYRMAVHIKWLVDGQGKDPRKPQARMDWINDLEWLRKTFHDSIKRRFEWP